MAVSEPRHALGVNQPHAAVGSGLRTQRAFDRDGQHQLARITRVGHLVGGLVASGWRLAQHEALLHAERPVEVPLLGGAATIAHPVVHHFRLLGPSHRRERLAAAIATPAKPRPPARRICPGCVCLQRAGRRFELERPVEQLRLQPMRCALGRHRPVRFQREPVAVGRAGLHRRDVRSPERRGHAVRPSLRLASSGRLRLRAAAGTAHSAGAALAATCGRQHHHQRREHDRPQGSKSERPRAHLTQIGRSIQ